MDEYEFVEKVKEIGYMTEGLPKLCKLGIETGYVIRLKPIKLEEFNWSKCDNSFLEDIRKVTNIPQNQMDFTTIKTIVKSEPFIKVVTTGLFKVIVAMRLINYKLPYHL